MHLVRNRPTIVHVLLLASVAILACVELAVAEAEPSSAKVATDQPHSRTLTTGASPDPTFLQERGGLVGTEEQTWWLTRLSTNLLEKVANTELVKRLSSHLFPESAEKAKVVAKTLFKEFKVDSVKQNLFESESFIRWSDRIKQAFIHNPEQIMFEVLMEHDQSMLFKAIENAKITTGLTPTVKGLERALLNKCINDMGTKKKLIDLYQNKLVQSWYQSSRESAVVQLQTKVDSIPDLKEQVGSIMVEVETSAIEVQKIAKDVMAISKAETELAVKPGASDSEIVASASLKNWLTAVEKNGFVPMEMLTARLQGSSHKEILELCGSKLILQDVRDGLQKTVFTKLKGQEGIRVLRLLDLDKVEDPYSTVLIISGLLL